MSKKKIDTHSYKGWLNSDFFLKRAFACLGYQMVALLIIYGILAILAIIIIIIGVVIGTSLAMN